MIEIYSAASARWLALAILEILDSGSSAALGAPPPTSTPSSTP
jgi:hypothetical protein